MIRRTHMTQELDHRLMACGASDTTIDIVERELHSRHRAIVQWLRDRADSYGDSPARDALREAARQLDGEPLT